MVILIALLNVAHLFVLVSHMLSHAEQELEYQARQTTEDFEATSYQRMAEVACRTTRNIELLTHWVNSNKSLAKYMDYPVVQIPVVVFLTIVFFLRLFCIAPCATLHVLFYAVSNAVYDTWKDLRLQAFRCVSRTILRHDISRKD